MAPAQPLPRQQTQLHDDSPGHNGRSTAHSRLATRASGGTAPPRARAHCGWSQDYVLQANRTGHTQNMNGENTRPNHHHTYTTPSQLSRTSTAAAAAGQRARATRWQRHAPIANRVEDRPWHADHCIYWNECMCEWVPEQTPKPEHVCKWCATRAPRLALLALGRGRNLAKLQEHHRQHPADLRGVRTRV